MYESHSFKTARAPRGRTDGSASSRRAGWNYSLNVEIQFVPIILYKSRAVVKSLVPGMGKILTMILLYGKMMT